MDTKQQLDAVQRYKVGYRSDEQGVRSSTPTCIPAHDGTWVRFADMQALQAGCNAARMEIASLQARIAELEAARFAYTSEFAPTPDGDPDVGSIHANIRALKTLVASLHTQMESVGAGGMEPLRKRECLHQIAEPDHFRGATEMVTAARQPLDDKAILQGRTDGYDAEDPPEGWAFAQGVRFAERAHGIKGEPQ